MERDFTWNVSLLHQFSIHPNSFKRNIHFKLVHRGQVMFPSHVLGEWKCLTIISHSHWYKGMPIISHGMLYIGFLWGQIKEQHSDCLHFCKQFNNLFAVTIFLIIFFFFYLDCYFLKRKSNTYKFYLQPLFRHPW